MLKLKPQTACVVTACALLTLFGVLPMFGAQNHVVSAAEMQKAAVAATTTHQHNLETVTQFVSSPQAEKALQSAHINPNQVKTAVSTLSDEEVSQLASRVDKAQSDFAAGRISDRDLILILIALVVVIVIIAAVH